MKLFNEENIEDYFKRKLSAIENEITIYNKDNLLKKDTDEYAKELAGKYQIATNLVLRDDQKKVKVETRAVPAKEMPTGIRFEGTGPTFPLTFVKYTIPCEGRITLLKVKPASMSSLYLDATLSSNNLIFSIKTKQQNDKLDDNTKNEVKQTAMEYISKIKEGIEKVHSECKIFNENLQDKATTLINTRKAEIKRKNDQEDSLLF